MKHCALQLEKCALKKAMASLHKLYNYRLEKVAVYDVVI